MRSIYNSTSAKNNKGKYFLQTVDIDLNGNSWTPIGYGGPNYNYPFTFSGTYDGNNCSVINIKFSSTYSSAIGYYYGGFFGYCESSTTIKNLHLVYTNEVYTCTTTDEQIGGVCATSVGSISNCSVENLMINKPRSSSTWFYFGGIAGEFVGDILSCSVKNCYLTSGTTATYEAWVGGIVGMMHGVGNIDDCIVDNFQVMDSVLYYVSGICANAQSSITLTNCFASGEINIIPGTYESNNYQSVGYAYSGALGMANSNVTMDNVVVDVDINVNTTTNYGMYTTVSGLLYGHESTSGVANITNCRYVGNININYAGRYLYVGGIAGGGFASKDTVSHCSFDGSISVTSSATTYCTGGLSSLRGGETNHITINGSINYVSTNGDLAGFCNNIYNIATAFHEIFVNAKISSNASVNDAFITNQNGWDVSCINCYYNIDETQMTSTFGIGYTATQMRDRSSFTDIEDFDDHFVINEYLNNGYPVLTVFSGMAQVTGFEGSGTDVDPYQIKTTADLQGMQAYYNEYDIIDEYWWVLTNDIDISVDANSLSINWCPIGYENGVITGFNGHFDGAGHTISGLTITEQYENAGLFGRLASNATIADLDVSGTISWDQAKYVGGIVGLMEEGATITDCTFSGVFTGYLNSNNLAVVGGLVGKHSENAITGSAQYECYVYGSNNYTTFNRFDTAYTLA